MLVETEENEMPVKDTKLNRRVRRLDDLSMGLWGYWNTLGNYYWRAARNEEDQNGKWIKQRTS
jgi:hypothetical protein